MTRRFRSALVAASITLAALPSLAHAQAGIAGRWIAEFELGVRTDNGVTTATGNGRARMILTAKGDSVFGTWHFIEPAESPTNPARALKGTFRSGTLVLETEPRGQPVELNGQASTLRVLTRYDLTLASDTLSGTQRVVLLDDPTIEPPSRPFKATREKR